MPPVLEVALAGVGDELTCAAHPDRPLVYQQAPHVRSDEAHDAVVVGLIDQRRNFGVGPRVIEERSLEVSREPRGRGDAARAHGALIQRCDLREVLSLKWPDFAHVGSIAPTWWPCGA